MKYDLSKDIQGRSWARVDQVRSGSKVEADGGFTCVTGGQIMEIREDPDDMLFFVCDEGRHYIAGQLDQTGKFYIGLYLVG